MEVILYKTPLGGPYTPLGGPHTPPARHLSGQNNTINMKKPTPKAGIFAIFVTAKNDTDCQG